MYRNDRKKSDSGEIVEGRTLRPRRFRRAFGIAPSGAETAPGRIATLWAPQCNASERRRRRRGTREMILSPVMNDELSVLSPRSRIASWQL